MTENLKTGTSGNITGTVSVSANRRYSISGYVETSHGRVETRVEERIDFLNSQNFNIVNPSNPSLYVQDITQSTVVHAKTVVLGDFVSQETENEFTYPLTVNISQVQNGDGSYAITTTIDQKKLLSREERLNHTLLYRSHSREQVSSADTLNLTAGFSVTGNSNQRSSSQYFAADSLGYCFSRELTSAGGLLTSAEDGEGCQRRDR